MMNLLKTGCFCLLGLAFLASPGFSAEDGYTVQGQRYTRTADEVALGRRLKVYSPGAARTQKRKVQTTDPVNPVVYPQGRAKGLETRHVVTSRLRVRLAPGVKLKAIAKRAGALEGEAFGSGDWALLRFKDGFDVLDKMDAIRQLPGVLEADPLLARKRFKRLIPNDPQFGAQWHLNNTGQNGGTAGIDANVTSVWDTYLGSGSVIAIVDDGLQVDHPDLSDNVRTDIDHDWNDAATPDDPSPGAGDTHGTSCAGVAAARGNNGMGVSGAAPQAKLVGLRLISENDNNGVTDAEEAEALGWETDIIDISSNSWGPNDDGLYMEKAGPLVISAFTNAVATGRSGRGSIFVWAGGNGGDWNDNSNYDGYANAVETIAVGAVTDGGVKAAYSEPGANLVICAPSDGGAQEISTTAISSAYRDDFGGTSSAAPLVAGVVALLLEANSALGWRDVQEILIRSAVKIQASDPGWVNNAAGIPFNHRYGAGMVDAQAAVTLAETWTLLTNQTTRTGGSASLNLAVPDNDSAGITYDIDLSAQANLRVEHARLRVSSNHALIGDLDIRLISPSGMESQLCVSDDIVDSGLTDYPLMSVRHWGESAQGLWQVQVSDRQTGDTGSITGLVLELLGTDAPDVATLPPTIYSNDSTIAYQGFPFSYPILATGSPTGYNATGLPAGLAVNTGSGLISGTTAVATGTYPVVLSASNANGSTNLTLQLEVAPPPGVAVATAIEQSGELYTFAGDADWTVRTDTSPAGASHAGSGSITHEQSSRLETSINLATDELLQFDWKVSSELDYDFLEFEVDGIVVAALSGETGWQPFAIPLSAGPHNLAWVYTKDSAGDDGDDRAYLDNLHFTATSDYLNWLREALDAPYVDFSWPLNSAAWMTQTTNTHDGVDGLVSPPVPDNSSASLRAQVNGPGTLSFRWRVSSEEDFDFLTFTTTDTHGSVVSSNQISGEVSWQQVSTNIPPGLHTVTWAYEKDEGFLEGSDQGWLDQVRFVADNSYEAWVDVHFPGDEFNFAVSGETANGEGDAYDNITEFFFNTSPSSQTTSIPYTVEITGSDSIVTLDVDTSKVGVDWVIEKSTDLIAPVVWTPMTTTVTETNGSIETHQAVQPNDETIRFIRLRFIR